MAEQFVDASAESATRRSNVLFNALTGLAILLGGFLLFQVQLIIAKYILPWFGGTPSVWTACLLFFQLVLLAGYGYSHVLATRLDLKKQTLFHVGLLVASVVALNALSFTWPSPITPGAAWKPGSDGEPTLLIIQFLLASVGLPFFLLSTTSPLLQHWFALRNPGRSPYRFYSLSNLGSLLGLLSYPLLLEPNLRLQTQAWTWSYGYYVFALLCALVAPWKLQSAAPRAGAALQEQGSGAPSGGRQLFWIALSACGSGMLLATTNLISQQVAVSPFMWVVPLSLYLISFILCFDATAYRREMFQLIFMLTAFTTCGLMLSAVHAPLLYQLMSFLGVLFASFMVCHGELSLNKPSPKYLTRFYLCMAVGGAVGGLFVSVVAPRVFSGLWEFPLGIVSTGVLMVLAVRHDRSSWWHRPFYWMPLTLIGAILLLVPAAAEAWKVETLLPSNAFYVSIAGMLILAAVLAQVWQGRWHATAFGAGITRTTAWMAIAVLAGGFLFEARARLQDSVARARNFYGVLAVVRGTSPAGDYLFLRDRMVDHGMQFADPKLARMPVGYYGGYSGMNVFMQNQLPATPVRVGVVGLGTGNLVAFSRPGDTYKFYEINPAVFQFADGPGAYFSYLRDARGKVELASGDARLTLEREAARGELQRFDVLILDAFSGDAVPVHILTKEAFELYLQHLRSTDSVIAVHITNRHLDLSHVLARVATEFGFSSVRIFRPWFGTFSSQTDWVLLSRNPASLSHGQLKLAGAASKLPADPKTLIWTDDYSNLLRVLK